MKSDLVYRFGADCNQVKSTCSDLLQDYSAKMRYHGGPEGQHLTRFISACQSSLPTESKLRLREVTLRRDVIIERCGPEAAEKQKIHMHAKDFMVSSDYI